MLAEEDAGKAYEAMKTLVGVPQQATVTIKARLLPAVMPDGDPDRPADRQLGQ